MNAVIPGLTGKRVPAMQDSASDAAVTARLRRQLIDALVDTEQVRRSLDTAKDAADELEKRIDAAAQSGLIEPDDQLFEQCRTLASATHAAAAASMRVAERVRQLR